MMKKSTPNVFENSSKLDIMPCFDFRYLVRDNSLKYYCLLPANCRRTRILDLQLNAIGLYEFRKNLRLLYENTRRGKSNLLPYRVTSA